MNQTPIRPKLSQLAAYPLNAACVSFIAILSGLILITPLYDIAETRILLNIVISFCFLRYITGLYAHAIWQFPAVPSFSGLLFNRYWPSFFLITGLLAGGLLVGQTILSVYDDSLIQAFSLFMIGLLYTSMIATVASHGKLRSAFQIKAIAQTVRYAQWQLFTPWLFTLLLATGFELSLPLLYAVMAPATAWLLCLSVGNYLLSVMIVGWAQQLKSLPIPQQATKKTSSKTHWFTMKAASFPSLQTRTSSTESFEFNTQTLTSPLEPAAMQTNLQPKPKTTKPAQPLHTPDAVRQVVENAPRPIQKNMPFVDQIFSLAQYYQQQGQPQKALATFRYGLSKLPTHQGLLKATIDTALSLSAFKEVQTYGRLAIAELVRERQIAAGLNLYQEITRQCSEFRLQNPRVIRQLAEASLQAKKWLTIIHLADQLHKRTNPHDDVAWCYLWLAQAFDTEKKDLIQSKHVLDYLLVNYPHHPAMNAIKHYWRKLKARIQSKNPDDESQKLA